MERHPELEIDLDKIVAAKFPGKKIPKWFINWLKRFIHQDYLNGFFTRGYEGVEFCSEALKYLDIDIEVEGLENVVVPEGSLMTFASNHPLGGVDGIALVSVIGNHFGENVKVMVNDFLMFLKGLAPLCIPINKTGGQSRNLPLLVQQMYQSDNNVIVCPAGLCSRKIDGKIQDIAWSKNFIKMSIQSGRYVVPVHFVGRNSKRFYNVASLCKWLKLKFNFAMLLLPDELYRARHGKYKIIFGRPVPSSVFDESRSPYDWAQWVREEVYKL